MTYNFYIKIYILNKTKKDFGSTFSFPFYIRLNGHRRCNATRKPLHTVLYNF
jgi:hypothetical protein